ncbi:Na+/H+ antiporter NhaA [Mucilaginibacter sp. UR6-11]|uniref:Na+/H+ antiporter NhaA n=1 Tax=Mucilaginibacter sp. UR6-11 TaxID=1435644 RepID=UPI001E41D9C2|nr:Na+/H+ antiporter NhaA [Mucilaginibacter sp. UR6-11]MCC8424160.1 Na+/H+ antiporter NhaA [Mucilaginibacter sp. UR6-11]
MIKRSTDPFSEFIQSEQAGGVLLIVCVIASLVIANTAAHDSFARLLACTFGYESAVIHLKYSLLGWINDGLMAIFFFLIGLEIKNEMIDGHLSSFKIAAVPIFAAVGGAIVPAVIFFAFNYGQPTGSGWAIPMATDIAFALGVLSLLGKLVPASLKVLLSTLAVVDDLLAIIIIAVFYSTTLHWLYLGIATGIFLLLLLMNKLGVKHVAFYLIPGIILWYFIHHSGVHATIAGVLTALAIPVSSKKGPVLAKLAHQLNTPVNFVIMPLFALANTNIHFEAGIINGVAGLLGLGIILGLVFGKPTGVMLFAWLTVKLKIGALPDQLSWKHIAGMGILAGIGFTMSIFISLLSFGRSAYNTEAKFAILIASVIAGVAGFLYLRRILIGNKKSPL